MSFVLYLGSQKTIATNQLHRFVMLSATLLDLCCDSHHNRYFQSVKELSGHKFPSCILFVASEGLRSKMPETFN